MTNIAKTRVALPELWLFGPDHRGRACSAIDSRILSNIHFLESIL